MNPLLWITMMYHMQWQLADEDDEEYQPRVEIRRLVSSIPTFPDIAAFGPKAVGALKLLQDWINDDVGAAPRADAPVALDSCEKVIVGVPLFRY